MPIVKSMNAAQKDTITMLSMQTVLFIMVSICWLFFFYCCCFEIPNSQCYSLWMYVSNCPIESNKGAHDLTLHRNNSFSISFTAWVRCSSCKSLKSTVFTVRTPLLLFDLEEFIKQTVSIWVKSRKMRFQTGRNIRRSRRWTSLNASHDINKKNWRTTKQNKTKREEICCGDDTLTDFSYDYTVFTNAIWFLSNSCFYFLFVVHCGPQKIFKSLCAKFVLEYV